MIELYKEKNIPFEKVAADKTAYDLSNVPFDEWREKINQYMNETYPFLSSGLQQMNYKTQDESNKNAIGEIVYESNGVSLSIPIIIEDGIMKDPDIAINDGVKVPLDEEYLSRELSTMNNQGEAVDKSTMDKRYEYTPQSGLFEGDESYLGKTAEVAIKAVLQEDEDNPYHYNATVLKATSDGKLKIASEYGNEQDISKYRELTKKAELESTLYVGEDARIKDMPLAKEITESGLYQSVLFDNKIREARVVTDLFTIIEDNAAKGKSLVFAGNEYSNCSPCECSNSGSDVEPDDKIWGFGKVYGTNFMNNIYMPFRDIMQDYDNSYKSPEDLNQKTIIFSYSQLNKVQDNNLKDKTWNEGKNVFSVPYYVERAESVLVGPDREKITILRVVSLAEELTKAVLLISDKASTVASVNPDKLKSNSMSFAAWGNNPVFIVPASYKVYLLGGTRKVVNEREVDYNNLVKEIDQDYPGILGLTKKAEDIYTVTATEPNTGEMVHYKDVNKTAALMLMNHYTGLNETDVDNFKVACNYHYKHQTINVPLPERKSVLGIYKGEFGKTASYLKKHVPESSFEKIALTKLADMETTVNDLMGLEELEDNEKVDFKKKINVMNDTLHNIAGLLIVARLGKIEVSEPILSRAMWSLTRLINELRGARQDD